MEIVILTGHPASACAFYRSVGVLQHLRKLDPSINVRMAEASNWSAIGGADLVFMERPQDERFLKAIQDCKAMGIPVWSDFDDDLFNLEPDNPGYSFYSQSKTRVAIKYCIANSDIVTVSTQEIATAFGSLNKKIEVIPNALNDYFFKLEVMKNEEPKFSWRGSATHRGDLLEYSDVMWGLAEKHPSVEWHFYGKDLWFITEQTQVTKGIKNSFAYGEMGLMEYFYDFRAKKPLVHLIPLKDTHFNRCKSNIAWMEGTWAGAACVSPTMPEFSKVQKDTYDGKLGFGEIAENLLLDKVYREETYLSSLEYIQKNLFLSKVNESRLQIAKDLVSK